MASKKNSTKRGSRTGNVLFSISWGGVVAVSLFMIIAMAWAFILGVMLGRGYQPETIVPQIARVMPKPEAVAPGPEKQPILKPEELGFFERLKDAPQRPAPEPEQKAARPAIQKEQAVSKPAPASSPEPATKPSPGPSRSVLFQVGSLRDKGAALKEEARMARLGLSAAVNPVIIKGAQWYRILVRASGTDADIAAVKQKLAKAGVKNPIIRKQ